MNISAIQTFLAVTQTGNLNRAAEQLNVTQSAITSRLNALEQSLGAKLLNRARSGATLTKAGYAFLDQAELIVTTWANARSQASLPKGVTRVFSLVCDPSLWSGLAAPWVADLRKQHAETASEIWSGAASDAQRWLQSGMSDAALLTEPLTGADLAHRLFAQENLVQVSSIPRAVQDWDPAYVFVNYGPAFRAQHTATWPRDDTAAASYSNPDWALAHVLDHGGSAYLPEALAHPYLTEGLLHRVTGAPRFQRQSYLSWRKASADIFGWLG